MMLNGSAKRWWKPWCVSIALLAAACSSHEYEGVDLRPGGSLGTGAENRRARRRETRKLN